MAVKAGGFLRIAFELLRDGSRGDWGGFLLEVERDWCADLLNLTVVYFI